MMSPIELRRIYMSKILSGMLLAGLLGVSAQADLLRVEVGAGVWQQDLDGTVEYKNRIPFNADQLGYDEENQPYVWLNIKHPVPILPNLRLEYTDVEFSGITNSDIQYDNVQFNQGALSTTSMEQFDAVLYYNILDNTAWTTIDLGIDVKYMDFKFDALGEGQIIGFPLTTTTQTVSEDESLVLPLAYGRVRVDLPFVDVGLEGDVKYVKYKDSSVTDYRIKLDYTLVDVLPVDVGLEAGYRFENVTIEEDDFSSFDVDADLDVDGFFFGAMVRF